MSLYLSQVTNDIFYGVSYYSIRRSHCQMFKISTPILTTWLKHIKYTLLCNDLLMFTMFHTVYSTEPLFMTWICFTIFSFINTGNHWRYLENWMFSLAHFTHFLKFFKKSASTWFYEYVKEENHLWRVLYNYNWTLRHNLLYEIFG